MARLRLAVALVAFLGAQAVPLAAAPAQDDVIGINVLLRGPASDAVLADLGAHGTVLDVMPEINAVTLRASESELAAIRALDCVTAAAPDAECRLAGGARPNVPDFSGGADDWNLDAINVTDFGVGRTVGYDGEGVAVAVIDTGLPRNWRKYFPEERVDQDLARAFGGGGGERGTESSRREDWERDTSGHGCAVASVILGFHYGGPEALPHQFNGVAPKATVIPLRLMPFKGGFRGSAVTRAILYVARLKARGALRDTPVVINISLALVGTERVWAAAIDYAIAQGVVVVAAAGNEGDAGLTFPANYPPVISVASVGSVGQFPSDETSRISWCLRDFPEDDALALYVAPDSSRALPGQDLDVAAPGAVVPVPFTVLGEEDYTFFYGTSLASPHVAGVAALMLEKNPRLKPCEIEGILERTAAPLPPGCRDLTFTGFEGDYPTWEHPETAFYFDATFCWDDSATGHGLLQADAALAATPRR